MIPIICKRKACRIYDIFIEENYFDTKDAEKIFTMGGKFGMIPKIHTDQFNSIGGIDTAIKFKAASVDHLEVLNSKDIQKLVSIIKIRATGKSLQPFFPGYLISLIFHMHLRGN